jgi:hypothetical protein
MRSQKSVSLTYRSTVETPHGPRDLVEVTGKADHAQLAQVITQACVAAPEVKRFAAYDGATLTLAVEWSTPDRQVEALEARAQAALDTRDAARRKRWAAVGAAVLTLAEIARQLWLLWA